MGLYRLLFIGLRVVSPSSIDHLLGHQKRSSGDHQRSACLRVLFDVFYLVHSGKVSAQRS